MSIVLVGHVKKQTNGSPSSAIDTTGATLLLAALLWYTGGSFVSFVDTKGNTWVALTQYSSTNRGVRLYYVLSPTVGSGHTFTLSASFGSFALAAFSGVTAFDSGKDSGDFSNSTTTQQPGSLTPSENNCLVIGAATVGDTTVNTAPTIDAPFATSDAFGWDGNGVGGGLWYDIQTTAGARNPTVTGVSGEIATALAVFKGPGGGGGGGSHAGPLADAALIKSLIGEGLVN